MKTNEVLRLLKKDGWMFKNQKGSHMQFVHPTKPGKVTVAFHGMNEEVMPKTLNNIKKQAGWK
jgi:predicted RNA binding protein YcfA (HicA-like mRNA interferase family)